MKEQREIRRKRILLAEDQPEVREVIKMLLGLEEYIVTEAGNGREALELFTQGQFDLVITDYAMPMMKGDELARHLKRMAPSQPVLMITGSDGELGVTQALVDVVLNKPFSLAELRRAIGQLLCPVPG